MVNGPGQNAVANRSIRGRASPLITRDLFQPICGPGKWTINGSKCWTIFGFEYFRDSSAESASAARP
jgi:hypothetical protein